MKYPTSLTVTLLFNTLVSLCSTAATISSNLDVRLQHYSRELTTEGVTRETRFEEKLIRREDHVWVERVLPANAAQKDDDHGHDHKELNVGVLPHHIYLRNKQLQLELIRREEREIVSVPQGEFGNVSFDGNWNNHFYLIDPARIKNMKSCPDKGSVPAVRCYVEQQKNGTLKVLWHPDNQFPEVLEFQSNDHRKIRRITSSAITSGKVAPWLNLKGYAAREYSDFLD
ncbi:hypothetical protein KSF73_13490 [Burkholderiaceae bacterium DAT-1]|nr:hypothetical protein [Burkholderiaceae bacterium DAT-1]